MHTYIGIFGILIGFTTIKFAYSLYQQLGKWQWAENTFEQGTTFAIQLIGLAIVVFSFLILTNTHAIILETILSPFVPKPH